MTQDRLRPRVTKVTDKQHQLAFEMEPIVRPDGGVHSIRVSVLNTALDRDVVLRLNERLEATFMVTITDSNGVVLTKKPPRYSTRDRQSFSYVHVSSGGRHDHVIDISKRMISRLTHDLVVAQLVAGCYLDYTLSDDPAAARKKNDFVRVSFTTYDTKVGLSRESK